MAGRVIIAIRIVSFLQITQRRFSVRRGWKILRAGPKGNGGLLSRMWVDRCVNVGWVRNGEDEYERWLVCVMCNGVVVVIFSFRIISKERFCIFSSVKTVKEAGLS